MAMGETPGVLERVSDPEKGSVVAAGLPSWVGFGRALGEDAWSADPGLYVWVGADGLSALLVGDHDDPALAEMRENCEQILAGAPPIPLGEPVDLNALVALVRVPGRHGLGHGPLGRRELRPARDLVAHALSLLS